MKKILKNLPIILLVILLSIGTFMSFQYVNASTGFVDNGDDEIWENINTKGLPDETETYPYNSEGSELEINSVSLDIAYNETKPLIVYQGEVPHIESCKKDSKDRVDEYDGIPCSDVDTSVVDDSNRYEICKTMDTISIDDYWGSNTWGDLTDDDGNISKATLECVNDNGVKSIRLYALTNCDKTGLLWGLGNIAYACVRGIAWLVLLVVRLVIKAKNITAGDALDSLGFDELGDMATKSFISNDGVLSPVTLFAIVFFLLAIVAEVFNYVKGNKGSLKKIWSETLVTAFIGFVIIFMCLNGKLWSMGSTLSNAVETLLYTVASDSTDTGKKAFKIDVKDKENENTLIATKELCLINKAFMEIQLCTQFGVDETSELEFDKLNIDASDSKLISKATRDEVTYLTKDEADLLDNNLGYYFWIADSPAQEYISKNTKIPTSNKAATQSRLDSMITALQHAYNNGTEAQQTKILSVVMGMSQNNTASGFVKMVLFIGVLCALIYCLLGYALRVVVNQMGLFISLIGMTLAGPLILSTKKKLVGYGKSIIGLMLMSFIKITVFAVMFDLILFATASIVSKPTVINMMIALGLLLLLAKFAKVIVEKLDRFLNDIVMPKIAPELRTTQAALNNYTNQKRRSAGDSIRRLGGNNPNSVRSRVFNRMGDTVGMQRDKKTSSTIAWATKVGAEKFQDSKLGSAARNAVESLDVNKRSDKKKQNLKIETEKAESNLQNVQRTINHETDNLVDAYNDEYNEMFDKIYTEDNLQLMTEEEKQLSLESRQYKDLANGIVNSDEYVAYENEVQSAKAEGREVNPDVKARLDRLKADYQEYVEKEKEQKAKLQQMVSDRVSQNVRANLGLNTNLDVDVRDSAQEVARANHERILRKSIQDVKSCAETEINTKRTSFGKIDAKTQQADKTRNYEALSKIALANQMLDQLDNHEELSEYKLDTYSESESHEYAGINKELNDENRELVKQIINRDKEKSNVDYKATKTDSVKDAEIDLIGARAKNDSLTRLNKDKQAKAEAQKAIHDAKQNIKEQKQKDKENKTQMKDLEKEVKKNKTLQEKVKDRMVNGDNHLVDALNSGQNNSSIKFNTSQIKNKNMRKTNNNNNGKK